MTSYSSITVLIVIFCSLICFARIKKYKTGFALYAELEFSDYNIDFSITTGSTISQDDRQQTHKNKCEKIIVNKLITDKTPKARLTAFKDSQVLNRRPHEIMICEIKEIVGLSLFELDISVA